MKKVSVIIPAYNVEKYIAETIESVINQTLKDIEIVVVDDASSDNTSRIIDSYKDKDDRIKVIHNSENAGTMLGLSYGINAADAEYIMILDGDDMLTSDACEKAYNAIVKENVDMVQYDIKVISDNEELYGERIKNMKSNFSHAGKMKTTGKNGLFKEQSAHNISLNCRNKIYSSKLLKKVNEFLPHEYIILAEDWLFSYIAHCLAHSYSYLPEELYIYRFGIGISTVETLSRRRMDSIAKTYFVYKHLEEWTRKHADIEICKPTLGRIKDELLSNIGYSFVIKCPKEDREYYLEQILKYCSIGEFSAIVSYVTYTKRISMHDLPAKICAELNSFKTTKEEIKTVGVFYYRMYNGGIESVISDLSDIWIKKGYKVVVFTDEKPNKLDYILNPAVKRVVLPSAEDGTLESYEERAFAWKNEIEKHNVDVLVYNAWANHFILSDLLAVKSTGCALIIHTHGPVSMETGGLITHAAILGNMLYRLYSLADNTITLSDVDSAWWTCCGIRNTKTINPIRMSFDAEQSKLNGKTMLFVGRIAPVKQVIDALEVTSLVKESIPDVKLILLGKADDEGYYNKVLEYIKSNNLETTVELADFSKDVTPFYQRADVLLSTSKDEGFGLALMESKICGLPLVAYDLPNLDVTRECRGMFVVPQKDSAGAADKVIQILKDEELKKSMGKEARQSILDMYKVDIGELWSEIFRKTLLPKKEWKPEYNRELTETAISLFIQSNIDGITSRESFLNNELIYYRNRSEYFEKELDYYRNEYNYYKKEYDYYEAEGDYLKSKNGIESKDADVTFVTSLPRGTRHSQDEYEALNKTIAEIRSSTSYRVGLFITYIPRKIKTIISKLKR